jgi:hypothetical protein
MSITGIARIEGPGAHWLAISGMQANEIFMVAAGASLDVSGLRLENGSAPIVGPQEGGAIFNAGSLVVDTCTVVDNTAADGAAIYNDGNAQILNSYLSNNTTSTVGGAVTNDFGASLTVSESSFVDNGGGGLGGAIFTEGTASVTSSTFQGNSDVQGGAIFNENQPLSVTNSTFFDNTASEDGGGISDAAGATATVTNSTLDSNQAPSGSDVYGQVNLKATILAGGGSGSDCGDGVTDGGYNIDDDGTCGLTYPSIPHSLTLDSTLGPLTNNAGPTETIAILSGNPGIDYVPAAGCPATDQRGVARIPPCDVGAYDSDTEAPLPQTITFTSTAPSDATVGGTAYDVMATGGGSGNPVVFTSATTPVCMVSGSSVSFIGIGTCTIDANQAGNGTYAAGTQADQSFSVAAAAGPCGGSATQCFTSAAGDSASVGSVFTFDVGTAGTPTAKIESHGKLPKGVKFYTGTGSATLSGTPTSTKHKSAIGIYPLTLTATFGKGKAKVIVTQAFTLTVED